MRTLARVPKLLNPMLRQLLAEAGRASALSYTIEDQTDQVIDLYGGILSAKRNRSL